MDSVCTRATARFLDSLADLPVIDVPAVREQWQELDLSLNPSRPERLARIPRVAFRDAVPQIVLDRDAASLAEDLYWFATWDLVALSGVFLFEWQESGWSREHRYWSPALACLGEIGRRESPDGGIFDQNDYEKVMRNKRVLLRMSILAQSIAASELAIRGGDDSFLIESSYIEELLVLIDRLEPYILDEFGPVD